MKKLLVAVAATFLAAGVYAKDVTNVADKAAAAESASAAVEKASEAAKDASATAESASEAAKDSSATAESASETSKDAATK